jgi:CII-binding regulator of phage lambda lysogenization HflD
MNDEEKARNTIRKTREMLNGLKKLVGKMTEVEESLKGTLDRHADTILLIGQDIDREKKVDAVLDITASVARAQTVVMNMTRKQMDLTLSQMGSLFESLEEELEDDAPDI